MPFKTDNKVTLWHGTSSFNLPCDIRNQNIWCYFKFSTDAETKVGFASIFQWILTRKRIGDIATFIVTTNPVIVTILSTEIHLMIALLGHLDQIQSRQIPKEKQHNQLLNAEFV